jgi:hypothetical protein
MPTISPVFAPDFDFFDRDFFLLPPARPFFDAGFRRGLDGASYSSSSGM